MEPPPKAITAQAFAATAFDFLIIGGGTAGLAVAARLSENPSFVVGVLEAGSSVLGDELVDVPGRAGVPLGSTIDWQFETTPQPDLGGRVIPWARGRVLGGSSALNFMTWNRAHRSDYDDWAKLGNEGWGWEDLLPFFKKSETFHAPSTPAQTAARVALHDGVVGLSGPVQVSYPFEFAASHAYWHETMGALGVASNDSHLAGLQVGCWTSMCSIDPRSLTRSYAATAYYQPNSMRTNLLLLTGAKVREILMERGGAGAEGWIAKGVLFTHQGVEYRALASREVVLSAGSIQTPQILELSGIGSEKILSAAGIEAKVQNENVGENLQDHITTCLVFEVDPSVANPDDLKSAAVLTAAREQYAKNRTGPLAVPPVTISYVPASQCIAADKLSAIIDSLPNPERPNATETPVTDRAIIRRRRFAENATEFGHVEYLFELGNWNAAFKPVKGKKYGSILQILQYPFSTGSTHLNPAEPTGPPSIDAGYLAGVGAADLAVAAGAARFAERIGATAPLAGGIVREQVWPPPEEVESEEAMRRWVRANLTTDWHPVGTCAMGGRAGKEGGVVDARLQVYGVQGLRVVDASVMPLQISAHLQATVYAIAEKGAAMILEDTHVTCVKSNSR